MRRVVYIAVFSVCAVALFAEQLPAQENFDPRLEKIQKRLDNLAKEVQDVESRMNRTTSTAVLFLFAAFCALWALNTNRNPWLWFFAGLFFHVITVIVLLDKDARDKRVARGEPVAGGVSRGAIVALILALIVVPSIIMLWMTLGGPG